MKTVSFTENQCESDCCPPGCYDLCLTFKGFRVKSSFPLKDGWGISFYHPPLAINIDEKCELSCKLSGIKDTSYTFSFDDSQNGGAWELLIPRFSEEILQTPLRVDLYSNQTINAKTESSALHPKEPIAYSNVPLGTIFTAKKDEFGRRIEGNSKIYRKDKLDKLIKIGYLSYYFTLTDSKNNGDGKSGVDESYSTSASDDTLDHYSSPELFSHQAASASSESPQYTDSKSYNIRSSRRASVSQTSLSVSALRFDREEKLLQNTLKEKEKANIQILSPQLKVQTQEQPASDISTSSAKIVEKLKLKVKELETENKMEVDSVNEKLVSALTDLETANGRMLILKEKLEAKASVSKLQDESNDPSDAGTIRKMWVKCDKLHQENVQLKKELSRSNEEKEHYKSQNKIVKELQLKSEESLAQLRAENNNMRLHMVTLQGNADKASHNTAVQNHQLSIMSQHNTGRGERLSIHHLKPTPTSINTTKGSSHLDDAELHPLLDITTRNRNEPRQEPAPDNYDYIDREIERLSQSRKWLLKTQAYTPSDTLILIIEAEILKYLKMKSTH